MNIDAMMKCGACLVVGRVLIVAVIAFVLLWPMVAVTLMQVYRADFTRFIKNGWDGCWPWSPKEVQYNPGMTLCPGQSAIVSIPGFLGRGTLLIPGVPVPIQPIPPEKKKKQPDDWSI